MYNLEKVDKWALSHVFSQCLLSKCLSAIPSFLLFIYLQIKKLARRQQQQQEQHNSQRLGQGEELSSVCVCVYCTG